MKWLQALKVGKAILERLDDAGVTIKGRHPAHVEQAIEDAATAVEKALRKPQPVPPAGSAGPRL